MTLLARIIERDQNPTLHQLDILCRIASRHGPLKDAAQLWIDRFLYARTEGQR